MLHNAKYAMSIFSQLGHVHLKMSKRCVKLFSLIFIIRCLTKCNLIQLLSSSSSSTSSSPLFLLSLSLSLSSLLLSLLLSLWSGQIFFSDHCFLRERVIAHGQRSLSVFSQRLSLGWSAPFFCCAATVLSPHRNVLIFTQGMHKPTWMPFTQ